ncbi:MAG TPA: hypothetical protein VFU71_18365 [Burkholderiaceae bacterium]|nr:hypothetical protein [Burkholderiaceae bacterium]
MSTSPATCAILARASVRRRRRAAVAEQLIARAPHAVDTLDWDALNGAPEWMGWGPEPLDALQLQVGALMLAPELRLWIDAPRLAAAMRALGAPMLRALLALPDSEVLPRDVAPAPHIERAEQVAPALRACGAAVLLAALAAGELRQAATLLLTPARPSSMASALARSLVARATHLAAQLAAPNAQEVA